MSIKQITQLPASTTLASTDVLAKETSGNTTQKITAQNMADSVKTLANLQETLTFDTTPTTGSTNPVTSGGIATAIAQSTATINTYNGSDGMIIYRVGRLAQLAVFPRVTTTASSAVLGTITNDAFKPSSRIWTASKVYNGSAYVDCTVEVTTEGVITVKSTTGGTIAGYQGQYLQALGLTYICNGA